VICGKTGTVENYANINGKPVKQPDHSFFGGFAPRNNPRIAIAVIVENSDQGARVAAPIASLMIEKYLKDSIRGTERKAMEVEYTNRVYIPPVMRTAMVEMAKKDSLKKEKNNCCWNRIVNRHPIPHQKKRRQWTQREDLLNRLKRRRRHARPTDQQLPLLYC
jgi:hypothetical protein